MKQVGANDGDRRNQQKQQHRKDVQQTTLLPGAKIKGEVAIHAIDEGNMQQHQIDLEIRGIIHFKYGQGWQDDRHVTDDHVKN